MEVAVRFPEGVRNVPAFNSPDHDMYAGMPGGYIITPRYMDGWKFTETLTGAVKWEAQSVAEKPQPAGRIYDNPNHEHYGPVRRLWVIFAGLGCLGCDSVYYRTWDKFWDQHLSTLLQQGWTEAKALRRITYHALDVVTLPDRDD